MWRQASQNQKPAPSAPVECTHCAARFNEIPQTPEICVNDSFFFFFLHNEFTERSRDILSLSSLYLANSLSERRRQIESYWSGLLDSELLSCVCAFFFFFFQNEINWEHLCSVIVGVVSHVVPIYPAVFHFGSLSRFAALQLDQKQGGVKSGYH